MGCRCLLILLFLLNFVFAQGGFQSPGRPGQRPPRDNERSPVKFRAWPVAVDSSHYRLYLIADVMYDFLQFTYQQGTYAARYRLEVTLTEEDGDRVFTRISKEAFTLPSFSETNRRDRFRLSIDSLSVPPGRYRLNLRYRDLQGQQGLKRELNLQLPPILAPHPAPPLWCDTPEDGEPDLFLKACRPLALIKQLPFNRKLKVLVNIWAPEADSIHVNLNVRREEPGTRPLFRYDTLLIPRARHAVAAIPLPSLAWDEGAYLLNIDYRGADKIRRQRVPFRIVWQNKPRSLRRLSYAVQALRILEPEKEFKQTFLANKKNLKQQFEAFWKKRDPSPGTAFNELLYEFYSRVDSADQAWGEKGRYGWRTDPGRIYVLYGPPDELEDHSLDPQNPHMVWIYHHPEGDAVFYFKSLDGRKRYRLIEERRQ